MSLISYASEVVSRAGAVVAWSIIVVEPAFVMAAWAAPHRPANPDARQPGDRGVERGRAGTWPAAGRHDQGLCAVQPQRATARVGRRQRGTAAVRVRPAATSRDPGRWRQGG